MKRDCDVCGGSGRVRLALRLKLSAYRASENVAIAAIPQASREYACPECTDTISQERLSVVIEVSTMDSRLAGEARYVDAAKKQAAYGLVDYLLRHGYVTFDIGREDEGKMTKPIRAVLGVVAPKAVATLEERVAERQTEVAREVVDEAARQISVWGSHYTGNEGHIRKAQAIDAVREAFKVVVDLARRRK
jgi:hypothetical protein